MRPCVGRFAGTGHGSACAEGPAVCRLTNMTVNNRPGLSLLLCRNPGPLMVMTLSGPLPVSLTLLPSALGPELANGPAESACYPDARTGASIDGAPAIDGTALAGLAPRARVAAACQRASASCVVPRTVTPGSDYKRPTPGF